MTWKILIIGLTALAAGMALATTVAIANPNVIYSDEYFEGKWTPVPPRRPKPRPECHLVPHWRLDIPTCLDRRAEHPHEPDQPHNEKCVPFGETERGKQYRERWRGLSDREKRESKAHSKGNGNRCGKCK